jgi:hypothetical protein
MKALLIATALAQLTGEECPVTLSLTTQHARVAARALPYARCIGSPSLPPPAELSARRTNCASLRSRALQSRRSAREMDLALGWIDQIAADLPGCETTVLFSTGHRR